MVMLDLIIFHKYFIYYWPSFSVINKYGNNNDGFLNMKIEYYKSNLMDRRSDLRENDIFLIETATDKKNLIMPVWRGDNYITSIDNPRPAFSDFNSHMDLVAIATEIIFLGHIIYDKSEKQAVFAIGLDDKDDKFDPATIGGGEFTDLRNIGQEISQEEGALLAYARGIVHWHKQHLFCGVCGSDTIIQNAGHMRKCCNDDCGKMHFPRTDPAVIMAVDDGADHLLLARHPAWPVGNHSVLAGFVEPAETLEQAVYREILEEVGIESYNITYKYSQPWPFPSAIMLGFNASANRDDELILDKNEIECAKWYRRDELLNSPENDKLRLPRHDSIARRLVNDWLKRGA